jgi:hypothetical protein
VLNDNLVMSVFKNMGPAFEAVSVFVKGAHDLSGVLKNDVPPAADETAAAMDDTAAETKTATDKFKEQTSAVTSLADELKGLDDALAAIANQETAEEVGIKAASAALDEQIKWRNAWVAGGGALTDEQKWELEVWKNQKEALDAQTDAIKASKEAYVDNVEALQRGRPTLADVKGKVDGATAAYLNFGASVTQATDDVNSCSLAPIQSGLENFATLANLAGNAASGMSLAWQQALRDSTAAFQGIARYIDEEAAHLQSLPYPVIPAPTPSAPRAPHPIPFALGGIVPGPWGQPRMIIAHGGEEVVPLSAMAMLPLAARGGSHLEPHVDVDVNVSGGDWNAIERIAMNALQRALSAARSTSYRGGAPLSSGIG